VTRAATAVCCCCRRESACRYDGLCFFSLYISLCYVSSISGQPNVCIARS